MLSFRRRSVDDPILTGHLEGASSRIATIARAHERLIDPTTSSRST